MIPRAQTPVFYNWESLGNALDNMERPTMTSPFRIVSPGRFQQ